MLGDLVATKNAQRRHAGCGTPRARLWHAGRKRALEALFQEATRPKLPERRTVLGVSRSRLLAGAGRVPVDKRRLAKFRDLTLSKLAAQSEVIERRKRGLKAHPRPGLRRGPSGRSGPAQLPQSGREPVRCLNASTAVLASGPGLSFRAHALHGTPALGRNLCGAARACQWLCGCR